MPRFKMSRNRIFAIVYCHLIALLIFGTKAAKSHEPCGANFFDCGDGHCVLPERKCDGVLDCKDGSDEKDCHSVHCTPPFWYHCETGECIDATRFCDGERDCWDGSDEPPNCKSDSPSFNDPETCSSDEFTCLNKECIKKSWVCDGHPDCQDASDESVDCEQDCSDGFRCKNNHCIIKDFQCDGQNDCGDNSDEESCNPVFYSVDKCPVERGYFICEDKVMCIPEDHVCNGFPECFDGSDEAECDGIQKLNQTYCRSLGCSHGCHETPHKHINCTCEKGYKLADDLKTCVDFDECSDFGFCHQRCKNLNGSFECSCDEAYVLQPDKRSCKAIGGDALLLFSSFNRIRGIYLESEVYFTVAKDLNHVIGVSHSGHHVYWTDISHGEVSIVRATESGSDMEILVNSGLGVPEDLAVDYVTNNIYFTDVLKKHIGVCTETGLSCAVLNNEDIDKPRALALYPQKGTMYWSDWGKVPMIATSGMDGSHPRPLVYKNLEWPNGLALDFSNDRLYWVDAKALTIETVRLDGSDRRVVLSKTVVHPFSVAVFEDTIYWSDWESREIQKCNKFTGKNRTSVVREKKKNLIHGVHIYHPVLYPRIENPCKNHRCSHICLLSPNLTYTCACPEHYELGVNLHVCRMRTKPLQVAVGGDKKLILVSPLHLGRQSVTEINLPDVSLIGCMTFDSLSGNVIISDVVQRKLFRFSPRTKVVTVLVDSGLGHISSLSFDSYGNNIYMTDSELRRVDVWSMKTSTLVTVLRLYNGDVPENIVVIPEYGVFFLAVSKAGGAINICRASMDGTQIVPHIGGEKIHGPKVTLSYDKKTQKVYWSDSDSEIIESMNVDGTGRKVVYATDGTPISVVSNNGLVLWVNRRSSMLHMYNDDDSFQEQNTLKLAVEEESYLSLTIVGELDSRHLHPCQDLSGCSHVCLVTTSGHSCHCPLGMHLAADNHTCLAPAHCKESQFKCRTDDICIAKVQRCDGQKDCPSGDDEKDCEMFQCRDDQFKCTNGQCIAAELKCDRENDCSDRSDEQFCQSTCSENNFQCGSGECIPDIRRCDFVKDCKDGSDERGCDESTCVPNSFRCKSGGCIPSTWECDQDFDCPDGSDEHERCQAPTCAPNEMKCTNGRCVSKVMACDGVDDCGDNSDEFLCTIREKELKCGSSEFLCQVSKSKCVPTVSRCNGTAECPRGEDEMDCSNCQVEEFQCKNMKCIHVKWVCDKENDCGDDSDEDPDLCSRKITSTGQVVGKCLDFTCRSGECIPMYLVCDGRQNCPDGSDEEGNCGTACQNHPCMQTCKPTPTGPRCACETGYQMSSDGYTCNDVDECALERCSQLCTNSQGSFNCSCMPDYILKSDRLTCKAKGPPLSYILAGESEIRNMSHHFSHIDYLLYEPGTQILGIALDARAGDIYWSTGINQRINVMNMHDKKRSFLIGAGQPGKLSLDWITGNVYYVDNSNFESIKACNLQQKKYASVVEVDQGFIISDLIFNPFTGVLYYSKVRPFSMTQPTAQIMQFSASESNSSVLVRSGVSWVSGFAYDHQRQYLYWCDLYHQIIEKIRFDGKDRQIVFHSEVHRPESLALFEDSLYWFTKGSGMLRKCKIYGDHKGSCHNIPFYFHDIKHLAIMQEAVQPNVSNQCRDKCDAYSLCMLSSNGPKCVCEDGTVLEEQKTCESSQMTLSNELRVRIARGNIREYLSHEKFPVIGNSSAVIGILMTALIICTAFASYLYIKKRRSRVILETIHFQNPSYGSSHLQSSFHPSELTPGEHQYENPTADLVRHPNGKYGVITIEKEGDSKKNRSLNLQDDESDSDFEDRIDMKASLIP